MGGKRDGGADFRHKYGPWALVAGGSEGLGAAFASELARRGLNLILISRRPGPLAETAGALRAEHAVQVRTLSLDLADPATMAVVERETARDEIGLLVCNAAVAYTGAFLKQELAEYQRILDVNCRSSLGLIHAHAKKMAARKRGGIVVMSSLAAFQGSPMVAVYGATKAFLVMLAEALADELKPLGVDVLACCPAVVLTPNFLSDGHAPDGPAPLSMQPADVARETIKALGRKTIVVPGAMSKLAHFMMVRLMPRRTTVALLGRRTRAMYREEAN
jgi:short-subunit dehydrogenase